MPNSLRCKIKHLCHNGTLTERERDRILKALEQEPCEDCISRQAAIDVMIKLEQDDIDRYGCKIPEGFDSSPAIEALDNLPSITSQPKAGQWIPVSERLPKTDNEISINKYNVLLWIKNKSHPEREPNIYLGKLRHIDGDDGSGNFWGVEIKPCDWTIWGWSYFNEPEVIAWQPLPQPYKEDKGDE